MFLLPNGNLQYDYYQEPIHFWDGDSYEDLNLSFIDKKLSFTNRNNYSVEIPKTLGVSNSMNVSYLNMYSINVFFEKELVNLESSILPGFNEESYIDYRTLDNSLYFEMVGKGLIHYSLIQSKVESYTTKFFISEQDLIFDNNEKSMFF